MIQSIKLGFYNLSSVVSFAVIQPPKARAVRLVKLRAKSGNQSSSPAHRPALARPKENITMEGANGSESLGDDASKIEKMTIQQLRSKLRSIGVPAKGSKDELLSALRSFIDLKSNGESSSLLEDEAEKANDVQRSSKRISQKVSRKDLFQKENIVLETSDPQTVKRRVKEGHAEDLKFKKMKYRKEGKESVESLEIEGKVSVQAKREVRSKTASINGVTSDKADLSVTESEPWTIFAHKKPQEGWIVYNPRCMRPPPLSVDTNHVNLLSWNVNGLRALLKSDSFGVLSQRENFDVLCLQETKLQERDVEAIKQSILDGYQYSYWTCSVSKLGYSGTAVISRIKPVSVQYGLGISDHDTEGRLVTVEFENFFLLNGYVPNSGDGLRRLSYRTTQWDPSLGNYMKELEKSKPVILAGDLNCAHEEIDIYNPAGNKRSAGFTIEERESFETNFLNRGFVDTFRRQHPGVVGYTYWGYRHGGRRTNRGWRLDYFLVSECVSKNVHDSYILPDIGGSDHSPIGLILKL